MALFKYSHLYGNGKAWAFASSKTKYSKSLATFKTINVVFPN
jgi:hypothetical protein